MRWTIVLTAPPSQNGKGRRRRVGLQLRGLVIRNVPSGLLLCARSEPMIIAPAEHTAWKTFYSEEAECDK